MLILDISIAYRLISCDSQFRNLFWFFSMTVASVQIVDLPFTNPYGFVWISFKLFYNFIPLYSSQILNNTGVITACCFIIISITQDLFSNWYVHSCVHLLKIIAKDLAMFVIIFFLKWYLFICKQKRWSINQSKCTRCECFLMLLVMVLSIEKI